MRSADKVAMAVRYLGQVLERLEPKVGETNAAGSTWTEERRLPPAVNVEDRRAAEFTEEEVAEVLRQAGFRSILPSIAAGN
mgnify:FL=1